MRACTGNAAHVSQAYRIVLTTQALHTCTLVCNYNRTDVGFTDSCKQLEKKIKAIATSFVVSLPFIQQEFFIATVLNL